MMKIQHNIKIIILLSSLGFMITGCGAPLSTSKEFVPKSNVHQIASKSYASYTNSRFHFRVEYPKSFLMERPPTDNDGRTWVSKDRNASFTVYGSYNVLNLTVSTGLHQYLETPTWEKQSLRPIITHYERGANWFTVYGYTNHSRKDIFCTKTIVGKHFYYVLSYGLKVSEASKYKPILERVLNSFVPGQL